MILPEIGTRAPDFTAVNQHGQAIMLSALRGAPVIVFFYPFAFTRVCTNELHAVRDSQASFQQAGARVLALSTDTMFTLRAFDEQEGLGFDLLSDHWPHGAIASSYGVFDTVKGCALRGSFVLDAQGVIGWSVVSEIGAERDLGAHLVALSRVAGLPSSR